MCFLCVDALCIVCNFALNDFIFVLQEKWNALERKVTNNSQPRFYNWFCEKKANDMQNHMLAPLRRDAGLGSPPQPYYQNNSECMNEVIKDQMKYQENELPEFLDKLTAIVARHETLLRKAVARTGEWELLPGFSFLERPDWFQMSPEQRESHMKTVMAVELTESRDIMNAMNHIPQPISTSPMLSLGYENIPNISEFTLQKIWKEAHELVTSPGYIQPVAGCDCPFARQVYNTKQPARPLVVTIQPVRKNDVGLNFACESACAQYAYLKLCCHTIATAEANGVLKDHIDFLKRKYSDAKLACSCEYGDPQRKWTKRRTAIQETNTHVQDTPHNGLIITKSSISLC